jgi:molybdenum cofactor cytidylyltransferase
MKADGIILAAGCSKRAGLFKPELDIAGKPLLVRSIESMRDSCERIIVVAGCRAERVGRITADIPGCVTVKNPAYRRGMFSSVRKGICEVRTEKFFVLPGDQPLIRPQTFLRMLEVKAAVAVPRYRGKKGHPVLFSAACIPELRAMRDTDILRDYIHVRKDVEVVDVDDPGIGIDVDTPQDIDRVRSYYREHR